MSSETYTRDDHTAAQVRKTVQSSGGKWGGTGGRFASCRCCRQPEYMSTRYFLSLLASDWYIIAAQSGRLLLAIVSTPFYPFDKQSLAFVLHSRVSNFLNARYRRFFLQKQTYRSRLNVNYEGNKIRVKTIGRLFVRWHKLLVWSKPAQVSAGLSGRINYSPRHWKYFCCHRDSDRVLFFVGRTDRMNSARRLHTALSTDSQVACDDEWKFI